MCYKAFCSCYCMSLTEDRSVSSSELCADAIVGTKTIRLNRAIAGRRCGSRRSENIPDLPQYESPVPKDNIRDWKDRMGLCRDVDSKLETRGRLARAVREHGAQPIHVLSNRKQ